MSVDERGGVEINEIWLSADRQRQHQSIVPRALDDGSGQNKRPAHLRSAHAFPIKVIRGGRTAI